MSPRNAVLLKPPSGSSPEVRPKLRQGQGCAEMVRAWDAPRFVSCWQVRAEAMDFVVLARGLDRRRIALILANKAARTPAGGGPRAAPQRTRWTLPALKSTRATAY